MKLTVQKRLEICRRYEEGETLKSIGFQFGVDPATIRNILIRANIQRRKQKLNSQKRLEICKIYQEGETLQSLASQFKVSDGTIKNILVRAKIQRRNPGRIKKFQKSVEKEQVIELYQQGKKSLIEIAKLFEVSTGPILRILKSENMMRSVSEACQKYDRNSEYFRKIDSEKAAYWLGFVAADGNLSKNTLSITLAIKDQKLLEDFRKDIESNAPIKVKKVKSSFLAKSTLAVKIAIGDKILASDLRQLGIIEAKTFILKFPPIEDQFFRHFILGFFDGDGTITEDKRPQITQACFSIPWQLPSSTNLSLSL